MRSHENQTNYRLVKNGKPKPTNVVVIEYIIFQWLWKVNIFYGMRLFYSYVTSWKQNDFICSVLQ